MKCLIWSWLVLKRRENINFVAPSWIFIRLDFFFDRYSFKPMPTVWNYNHFHANMQKWKRKNQQNIMKLNKCKRNVRRACGRWKKEWTTFEAKLSWRKRTFGRCIRTKTWFNWSAFFAYLVTLSFHWFPKRPIIFCCDAPVRPTWTIRLSLIKLFGIFNSIYYFIKLTFTFRSCFIFVSLRDIISM